MIAPKLKIVRAIIGITCEQCVQHEEIEHIKPSEESYYNLQQL
jgi:phosphopantetheine adenylyltransferase